MTERSADILPPDQSIGGVTDQLTGIPLHFPVERRWLIAMIFASAASAPVDGLGTELFTGGVGIWGINIPVNWAFAIHNYVWWLGIGHAGTLISALLLLTGQRMAQFAQSLCRDDDAVRRGLRRHLSDAASRPALVLYWMFPYPATMGVWPQFRSPLEWDIWAVLTYLTVSLVFWYIGLIPDLAAARDRAHQARLADLLRRPSLGWRGSAVHWLRWSAGLSATRRAGRAAGRLGA